MRKTGIHIGIDIGSTTAKIVVLNSDNLILYEDYRRHFADIRLCVTTMMEEVVAGLGDIRCTVAITGSGGLTLSKVIGADFVQEVIAVFTAVRDEIKAADCVIELGGEDAKIIFLKEMEQRMNGICAGGTGAFIDQMASLLQTDASGLNEYAKTYNEIYPIAARCGVFAKSDIQPLINDGVDREDLAASIFQAVVNQTISGLACGRKITGKVVFLGGPLFFLSELQKAFVRTLKLIPGETAIFPEKAHLFAARGAAIKGARGTEHSLLDIISTLKHNKTVSAELAILPPLFEDDKELAMFLGRQVRQRVPRGDLAAYEGKAYLGVDAGSTTMKLALIGEDGKLLYSWYGNNEGEPLRVCKEALLEMFFLLNDRTEIAYSCSTGYGEELLKNAFSFDEGEVETISHFYAARFFKPDVDCVLDIGGQDMKFMRIKNGSLENIVLNEACSSGCGSFIENFANSMGCTAEEFAQKALLSKNPIDLGTRCTVFMNSNVKQAQKEGASIEDIAGGLAYSVIKNALFKVIKMKSVQDLGKKVVVQGGTFCNDAVLRCFELISGTEAIRPDIAGLMGAFGAALIAKERSTEAASSMISPQEVAAFSYETTLTRCNGCQNQCRLTVNSFFNGKHFISGNRCERAVKGKKFSDGIPNLVEYKMNRMFDYEPLLKEKATRGTIGIPRVLNMYENYPFWAVFFKTLGFRTVLSPLSDTKIYALGMDSIPSESECYPAKLAHGHVEWLINHGVTRIFYPCVYYERKESSTQQNSFNCPMVISYPENIRNNMESLYKKNIEFYDPFIAFTDESILAESLLPFMKETFNVTKKELLPAVRAGWQALKDAKSDILEEGKKTLEWIDKHKATGIVLAGRPYHVDPEINHGIPRLIQSLGFAVLTEDSIAQLNGDSLVKIRATNQWTYHARLYNAAQIIAERDDLELIQLNSFGCGLDAVTIDQVKELLDSVGKLYTLLKIDEVNNLGAAKIRIRSMIAAIYMRDGKKMPAHTKVIDYERPIYTNDMRKEKYTILCTGMVQPHFDFFEAALRTCGYNMVLMRSESRNVLDMGLKYVNNDACYPTMIVTGQILDEVASGKYNADKLAVFMVQTGGGCRASNYVGFIRKALKDMGYPHIPVISINPGGMETNPGMRYSFKMGFKCMQALIYGDILLKVVHRMRPYEKVEGQTNELYNKWHDICVKALADKKVNNLKFHENCRTMIREFDCIPITGVEKPKVGIVGEVLVKYMPFANNHLANIIEAEGGEAVVPDFVEFLSYCFWNAEYRYSKFGEAKAAAIISKILNRVFKYSRRKVMRKYRKSMHFNEPAHLNKIKKVAQQILQLGNQCGEGWYLAGEMICLIKEKVNNIVCVQPFGCLPNHVVGKGVIKKLKELYPHSNVVAIDYDPSASRVNQLNRIKLMLEVAAENMESRFCRRDSLSQGT